MDAMVERVGALYAAGGTRALGRAHPVHHPLPVTPGAERHAVDAIAGRARSLRIRLRTRADAAEIRQNDPREQAGT